MITRKDFFGGIRFFRHPEKSVVVHVVARLKSFVNGSRELENFQSKGVDIRNDVCKEAVNSVPLSFEIDINVWSHYG